MARMDNLAAKDPEELRKLADRAFERHAQAREARQRTGGPTGKHTMEDDVMEDHMANLRAIDEELRRRGLDGGGY